MAGERGRVGGRGRERGRAGEGEGERERRPSHDNRCWYEVSTKVFQLEPVGGCTRRVRSHQDGRGRW